MSGHWHFGTASADDSQGDSGLELLHAIDNVSQSITVQLRLQEDRHVNDVIDFDM